MNLQDALTHDRALLITSYFCPGSDWNSIVWRWDKPYVTVMNGVCKDCNRKKCVTNQLINSSAFSARPRFPPPRFLSTRFKGRMCQVLFRASSRGNVLLEFLRPVFSSSFFQPPEIFWPRHSAVTPRRRYQFLCWVRGHGRNQRFAQMSMFGRVGRRDVVCDIIRLKKSQREMKMLFALTVTGRLLQYLQSSAPSDSMHTVWIVISAVSNT